MASFSIQASTFTSQPGPTDGQDCYIYTDHYGVNNAILQIGRWPGLGLVYLTLIRFDVGKIPATASNFQATLTLYNNDNSLFVGGVRSFGVEVLHNENWTENATYRTYNGTSRWNALGGDVHNDLLATTTGISHLDPTITFDVSELLEHALLHHHSRYLDLRIRDLTGGLSTAIYIAHSSEATDETKRPLLEVAYDDHHLAPAIEFTVNLARSMTEYVGPATNKVLSAIPALNSTITSSVEITPGYVLKHGDTFTEYGEKAIYLRDTYGIGYAPNDRAVLTVINTH